MIEGHGDDSYKYKGGIKANFSSNVYNAVDHTGLKKYLSRRMNVVASYPEPGPYSLERLLGCRLDIPSECVCATNGATEAIYLIAQTFRDSRTAVLVPTFSEYADACRIHGHKVEYIRSLRKIPRGIRTVWLCNPNNPTGTVTDKDFLKEVVLSHPDTYFIIDQSYEDFTLQPVFSAREAAGYPNLILLHSMTKHYAIPGLRLGYFTACEPLAYKIRGNRMPWSVNALAVEAGRYLLENGLPDLPDLAVYLSERERLARRVEGLGAFCPLPSDTHFMLVRIGRRSGSCREKEWRTAAVLKEYLATEEGILIRDASNFYGLDERFFRIAAQTPQENDYLVEGLARWLEKYKKTRRRI